MINYIIPFGSDCYAAITIETLKLRIRSLPFDYIYSDINMLKDCLENNFINFLDEKNYIAYKSNGKGCINNYYRKKFPHFNMLNDDFRNTMIKRTELFNKILSYKDKKLFVHICSDFNIKYIEELNNLITKYSNNYELLVIVKKRNIENKCDLKYNKDNIKVYNVFTTTKAIHNNIINEIFNNYKFDLIK